MNRLILWPATLLVALALMGPMSAQAQQGALALVNSNPITGLDVAQRIRIAQLTERRRLDQRTALQELIDDQVKLIQARKLGYRLTEEGVEAEYTRIARTGGRTTAQFEEALRQAGVNPNSLRDKLRADLAWQVVLRDQARRGTQLSAAEIDAAVAEAQAKQRAVIDYQLQSVIFVVPRGSSPGERERAANAARARFTGCENGFEDLRTMKDVAVRPPAYRSTEQMSEQLVKVLANTPVGKLTPAFRSDQGIEMVAVCERKPREGNAMIRQEVTGQLTERRVTENARAYLQELRKSVDIRLLR
jgi:peptidyl-prolyl cis-trans isomerase SurA